MDYLLIILVVIGAIVLVLIGYILGRKMGFMQGQREIPNLIKEARDDATKRSRAVIGGQVSEQLAPYFPDFPYNPSEARFIGKPIDFLIFKGMDEKDITEVIFVEVKSGKSSLSTHERKLRDAINNKNVKWEEYRLP